MSRRERVCLAAARRGCRRVSTGGLPGSAPAVARPPGPRFITPVVARGEVAFRAGDRRRSLLLPPARATHPAPRPVWATVPALPMPRGRGVWGREACGECRGVVGSARPRVPVLCVCGRVPDHRWGGLAARVPVPPARLRSVARARASADPRAPSSLSLPTPSLPGFARASYLVDPASSICLSQRLSHACLSTHGRYSETANGSLNQLWFLWSLAPLLLG